MLESGSQLGIEEKRILLKEVRLTSLISSTSPAYFRAYILKNLKGETKDEIDDEIDAYESAIGGLTGTDKEKMAELMLMEGNSLPNEEKLRLAKEVAKAKLATDITYKFFHSYILKNIKGESVTEVEDEIDSYFNTISVLTGDNETKMAQLQLNDGIQLGLEEKKRLLKKVAIGYLKTKAGVDYFKNYILSLVANAEDVQQVTDIVDSIEDTLNSIVEPTGLSAENINRYKMSILLNDSGSEIGKAEKELLIKSLATSILNTVFVDAKYSYYVPSLMQLLDMSTYESITNSATHLKNKIDDLLLSVSSNYAFMVGLSIVDEYILNRIISEASASELHAQREMILMNSIAKYVYSNIVAQSLADENTAKVLLSMPVEKMNIRNIEDIEKSITSVNNIFIESRKRILSDGWYFNTVTIDLQPNTTGYIAIPKSFLSVDGSNESDTYTIRDWKLFDLSALTFIFEDKVECIVVEDIPYDDVPSIVSEYIYSDAELEAYKALIGTDREITFTMRMLEKAKVNALREDANNIDGNLLSDTHSSPMLDRTSV